MIHVAPRLAPVARPTIGDAVVYGDLVAEGEAEVVVGGVSLRFERTDDGNWTGPTSTTTAARGHAIDEGWLVAARGVAVAAMTRHLAARGATAEVATDTVRCTECGRLLCSSELVNAPPDTPGISCGPVHLLAYDDGRVLSLRPDGSAAWLKEEGA